MRERSITTGVSIEMKLLDEIDKRRREKGAKEGRDIPRSTYICELLRSALNNEKKVR
jgi:metal-responsive CopG/Arc/MetJ family transcriptional regulator